MQPKDAQALLCVIKKGNWLRATSWTRKFLISIQDRVDIGMPLTSKQSAKLQEIYRNSQDGYVFSRTRNFESFDEDREQDALDVNDF